MVAAVEIRTRTDGPPPKRRCIAAPAKPRTTAQIDLAQRGEQDDDGLEALISALKKKRRIVVIAGAGISVSAGIPDFRSSTGLFATLGGQNGHKASGKHLFDASVYKQDSSTQSFHAMVCGLAKMTSEAKPTPFHHMLASLASEGRLMRLYTQNIDALDTRMLPLATETPLNAKGPWPTTIQLHGDLEKMVCAKCNRVEPFNASLFDGPEPPPCRACTERDLMWTTSGRRSHGIGRLRPRIVLYNEYNPDEEAIGRVSEADLRSVPDAVIVVGTSLSIPGVRKLVKEMCQVATNTRDGITAWINPDPEPRGDGFKNCWDFVVRGRCDDLAGLADLPHWDRRPRSAGSPPPEQSGRLWGNPLLTSNDVGQGRLAHGTCPAPDRSLLRPNELATSKNAPEPPGRSNTAERRAKTPDALKNHFVPIIDLTRDGTLSPAAGRLQTTTRGPRQAGHEAGAPIIIDLTGD